MYLSNSRASTTRRVARARSSARRFSRSARQVADSSRRRPGNRGAAGHRPRRLPGIRLRQGRGIPQDPDHVLYPLRRRSQGNSEWARWVPALSQGRPVDVHRGRCTRVRSARRSDQRGSPNFVRTSLTAAAAALPGLIEDSIEHRDQPGRYARGCSNAVSSPCSLIALWVSGEVLEVNGGVQLTRYSDMMKHLPQHESPCLAVEHDIE
jgi:hypothetical protein